MNGDIWSHRPTEQQYRYFADFPFFRCANDLHENVAIYVLQDGEFEYRVGSAEAQILKKGELVICPANVNFNKKVLKTVTMHLINLALPDGLITNALKIKYEGNERIEETLLRLNSLVCQSEMPTDIYREHLINDLWYSVISDVANPFVSYEMEVSDPFLLEMKAYIETHLNASLADVAQAFHCSRVTVNKHFKRYTGQSVGEYVTRSRIAAACRMIVESNEPFKSIASACGFSNEYYFHTVFKRITGSAPGQYLQKNRK